MEFHRLLKHIIITGNIICILVSLITFCVTLGRWYVIVAAVFSLIVALTGILFALRLQYNSLLTFAVAAILDLLIFLSVCIILLVFLGNLKRLCVDLDNSYIDVLPYEQGCSNYYEGSYLGRTVAVVTLFFITFLTRMSHIFSTVLLLKFLIDGGKVETDDDT